jgi:hypothetical protein
MTRKSDSQPEVKGLLIDPFKGCVVELLFKPNDIDWMHQILDCDMIEHVGMGADHDLWCDENALAREPFVYPQFCFPDSNINDGCPIAGYALVTSHRGADIDSCKIPPMELGRSIQFEPWQLRINPDDCINQLLRIYLPPHGI